MFFEQIGKRIYWLKVPYFDIYTSVFAIVDGKQCVLFDCGDSSSDVEKIILPALQNAGLKPDILVLSHLHQDHSGGADALKIAYPDLRVLSFDPLALNGIKCKVEKLDIENKLTPHVKVMHLPGHSHDCVALFETEEKILLSGDALQQWGIDRWGTCVTDGRSYRRSIDRVATLGPKRIVASHDFDPLGQDFEGRENIEEMLSECQETFYDIEDLIYDYPNKSAEVLVSLYARLYPTRPVAASATFKAMLSK